MVTSPPESGSARPAPPSRPLLLRGYRRAVPPRLRRALSGIGGARARTGLKTAVAAASRPLDDAARRRALRAFRASGTIRGDTAVVIRRGTVRLALASPAPTPLRARTANLGMVCEALDAAGVDHFAVRGYGARNSVVGVSTADRARAVAALQDLCRTVPAYVSHAQGVELPTGAVPGCAPDAWQRTASAPVLRLSCYRTDPSQRIVLDTDYGCDIEFWTAEDGALHAPRANRAAESVLAGAAPVTAEGHLFTHLASQASALPAVRTRPEFAASIQDDIGFPIDLVYTWVDGSDPLWRKRRAAVLEVPYHEESDNEARYANHDELRYSLRSAHAYAPWVRHIYVVTDNQVPEWLDPDRPGITVVDHSDIFEDPAMLPTFNSHAIESRLHHIEGLSEHFLYLNDDIMFGCPVTPHRFFLPNGLTKYFPSRALLPARPPLPEDPPVSVAGLNNRRLLAGRFGATVTRKFKHAPFALRRSILAEIEAEFPEEHRATAGSRFRSMGDHSIPSSLYHHYANLTGRAVEGGIAYGYVDIRAGSAVRELGALLRRRNRHAFCLNDTGSTDRAPASVARTVGEFLDAYFPVPSPYERAGRPGG